MEGSQAARIRLLLVDDHELFRESLARLLQSEVDFEVVAHCGTTADALPFLHAQAVDIVLLDVDLGSERGTDLLDRLQKIGFAGKVLLVTAGVNENDVPDLVRKGATGILLKHNSPALLIQGIRDAMNGKVSFDHELLKRAFEHQANREVGSSRAGITPREKKVLSFVFEGLGNKEIASRLQISESAVKSCLHNLFMKTGVSTRSQLVRVALERYRDEL